MDAWKLFEAIRMDAVGKMVIDIGANQGDMTNIFSAWVGQGGLVHAFEPGPGAMRRLMSRLIDSPTPPEKETNGEPLSVFPHKNVVCWQYGISDESKLVTNLQFYNAWTLARPGQTSFNMPSPGAMINEPKKFFDVQFISLDHWADIKPGQANWYDELDLALIKLDTDGYELRALRGMERLLKKTGYPPIHFEMSFLLKEIGDCEFEMIDLIVDELGYKVYPFIIETTAHLSTQMDKAELIEKFPYHTSWDCLLVKDSWTDTHL